LSTCETFVWYGVKLVYAMMEVMEPSRSSVNLFNIEYLLI